VPRMPRGPQIEKPELEPHEKLAQAYRNAFTSESGRVVLDDLRKAYGRRSSFVAGDPCVTAFHEGERGVYLRVMQYLDPEMIEQEEIL
jgi:hypothetical protein